jgi:peptidoglycan/xylan/chitin deacetylase (PgdA/CDA1 family)
MERTPTAPRAIPVVLLALVLSLVPVVPGMADRAASAQGSGIAASAPSPTPRTTREDPSRERVLAWLSGVIERLERDVARPTPTPVRSRPQATPDAQAPEPTRTPAPAPVDGSAAPRARILRHGPRRQPVVALTFDDGWGWRRCARIVSILDSRRIPATFFPNAMYVYWAPALWRDVAQRYPIGNHTAHHRSLPRLSESAIRREIDTDERRIERVTGVPMLKVLRPPYGAVSDRVQRVAASLGYHTILLWDTSIGDTSRRSGERTMQQRALEGTAGSVVLMHCGSRQTVDLLPGIIDDYLARGYRFVTVPELLGIPWQAPHPLPPLPPLASMPQPTVAPIP